MTAKVYTLILAILLSATVASAQRKLAPKPKLNTGNEQHKVNPKEAGFKVSENKLHIPTVRTSLFAFYFTDTDVSTIYDLQSNAVPNQIWQDPLNPSKVHAACMYSLEPGFPTRKCAYLYSDNGGQTWTNLFDVPSSGRSGFPSISGFPDYIGGSPAIIANHNTTNGTTARTKVNIDAGPGFGVFTEIDPGLLQGADGVWPRVLGITGNRVVIVTSVSGQVVSATNVATSIVPPGVFSGYQTYPGDQAETYSLSLAPNGTVGHAFIGANDGINNNDVFFRNSTDGGISWSAPVLVWDFSEATDSLGCLRGVSMVYGNNNEPYVAFNIGLMTLAGNFDPAGPSSIRVWSPAVNGGIPKIIADQSSVPFFPNLGLTNDAFIPICRPAIGKSSNGNNLFVSFVATTGEYSPVDTCSYYAGWFANSTDNGTNWFAPDRFTPATPLRDWRFISISQTSNSEPGYVSVRMIALSDSLAGSHVNGAQIGTGKFISIKAEILFSVNQIGNSVPDGFDLYNNYPNPFNPSTKITFDIPKNSNVKLTVFDYLGKEIKTLVNENLSSGKYETEFNAEGLSSGVYFYRLETDGAAITKSMVLLK